MIITRLKIASFFFNVSEIIKMVETAQIDRMINLGIAPSFELLK